MIYLLFTDPSFVGRTNSEFNQQLKQSLLTMYSVHFQLNKFEEYA